MNVFLVAVLIIVIVCIIKLMYAWPYYLSYLQICFQIRTETFDELVLAKTGSPECLTKTLVSESILNKELGLEGLFQKTKQYFVESKPTPLRDVLAIVGSSAIESLSVLYKWRKVDKRILKAFEHISKTQISGISDLINIVNLEKYALGSIEFTNKVVSHVGAIDVASHFESAGLTTSVQDDMHNNAISILVDNHQLAHVLTVEDVGSYIADHFIDCQNVPIIVPFDAAHIPTGSGQFSQYSANSDALDALSNSVVVDQSLSQTETIAQVQRAVNVIENPGPDTGIPWLTFIQSIYREGDLVAKGYIDFSRAAANVVIDTAAVASGGWIGAKIGMILGIIINPIFGIILATSGTVVGGSLGKSLAKSIRLRDFNRAKDVYDSAYNNYTVERTKLIQGLPVEIKVITANESKKLTFYSEQLQRKFNASMNLQFLELESASEITKKTAVRYLAMAWRQVDIAVKIVKFHTTLARIFSSVEKTESLEIGLSNLENSAKNWKNKAELLIMTWDSNESATTDCLNFVLATPFGKNKVKAFLNKVTYKRRSVIKKCGWLHRINLTRIVIKRQSTIMRIKKQTEQAMDRVKAAINSLTRALANAARDVQLEARKAGVELKS